MAENLLVVVFLPVLLTLGRRQAKADNIPGALLPITSSSSSSVLQAGTLPQFLD